MDCNYTFIWDCVEFASDSHSEEPLDVEPLPDDPLSDGLAELLVVDTAVTLLVAVELLSVVVVGGLAAS